MTTTPISSQATANIQWLNARPSIQTSRFTLNPIQGQDLKFYQDLFVNKTAMKQYLGNVRTPDQTERRFNIWLDRWNTHFFSAMKITDKTSASIGHIILGHGDYESSDRGWSEMAIVIHPHYWNSKFKDTEQDIGLAEMQGVGTEVVQAIVDYAKCLFQQKALVPVDITKKQAEEVNSLVEQGIIKKVIRDSNGSLETVFVPFESIKASCLRSNVAVHRIFEQIFVKTHGGVCKASEVDSERDLFEIQFHS
jgi:Acetyltransferase (GNAT) domain